MQLQTLKYESHHLELATPEGLASLALPAAGELRCLAALISKQSPRPPHSRNECIGGNLLQLRPHVMLPWKAPILAHLAFLHLHRAASLLRFGAPGLSGSVV